MESTISSLGNSIEVGRSFQGEQAWSKEWDARLLCKGGVPKNEVLVTGSITTN